MNYKKVIKDLKERNDKLQEQYRLRDIRCVHLEQENQELKAINEEHRKINDMLREENQKLNITKSSCGFCPYNSARIENQKYKEAISKAIEYIEDKMELTKECPNELLDILKEVE